MSSGEDETLDMLSVHYNVNTCVQNRLGYVKVVFSPIEPSMLPMPVYQ